MNFTFVVRSEKGKETAFELGKDDYWRTSAEDLGVLIQKKLSPLLDVSML